MTTHQSAHSLIHSIYRLIDRSITLLLISFENRTERSHSKMSRRRFTPEADTWRSPATSMDADDVRIIYTPKTVTKQQLLLADSSEGGWKHNLKNNSHLTMISARSVVFVSVFTIYCCKTIAFKTKFYIVALWRFCLSHDRSNYDWLCPVTLRTVGLNLYKEETWKTCKSSCTLIHRCRPVSIFMPDI